MSFRVNKQEADSGGVVPAGRYHAEVVACEQKASKRNGDAYYAITFKEVGTGRALCQDTAMLEGKGAGIGTKKLKALGVVKEDGLDYVVPDAGEVVGARCYLHLAHERYTKQDGSTGISAKPDFACVAFQFGYEPSAVVTSSPIAPDPFDEAAKADDIPF